MHSEGLKVRLSRIRQGGSNFEFASLVLNKDKGIIGVKSDDADTRTSVYENRLACPERSRRVGVRGAPRQYLLAGPSTRLAVVHCYSSLSFFFFHQ